MNKKLKKILIIIAAIAVFVGLFFILSRVIGRAGAKVYYKASADGFSYPGAENGFRPAGISYDEKGGNFFLSGQEKDGKAVVWIVEKETGKAKKKVYLMDTEAGVDTYTGEANGIAVTAHYVYVTSDQSELLVFDKALFYMTSNGKSVPCIGRVKVCAPGGETVSPACLAADEPYLYVGDKNSPQLVRCTFSIEEGSEFGIVPTATDAFTVCEDVKGCALSDGALYVTSASKNGKSCLWKYRLEDGALTGSDSVPLPPKAGEITVVGGKMYLVSTFPQSFFGKLIQGNQCLATDLSEMQ